MQTGLVPPKLACAVYSITAGANFIQGRKRAFYTVQGGEGGEVADMYRKSLNVYEKGRHVRGKGKEVWKGSNNEDKYLEDHKGLSTERRNIFR